MTVFDDGDKDTLRGQKGRDWHFAAVTDKLKDKKSNEALDVL